MTNRKFWTLLDKAYDTLNAAIEAEKSLIEAGYVLDGIYIEEWNTDEIYGRDGRHWREEYADQCNRLIDWVPQ